MLATVPQLKPIICSSKFCGVDILDNSGFLNEAPLLSTTSPFKSFHQIVDSKSLIRFVFKPGGFGTLLFIHLILYLIPLYPI